MKKTFAQLEASIQAMEAAAQDCRDNGLFDTAEDIDSAVGFMILLRQTEDHDLLRPSDDLEEDKMDATMESLREMGFLMREKQTRDSELKGERTDLKIGLDDLRLRKIPDMMESLGVKTATFNGLGRIQTAPDLYASTRKGMKPAAMQWLRDCGYENMIVETYNASSLKALFRRQIAEGVEIPEDIFSVQPFIRASIVKA